MSPPAQLPASYESGRLAVRDHGEAARLIHASLNAWYGSQLNQPGRFGEDWQPFRIFPDVYAELDPGCAVTVRSRDDGRLVGICFYHPRPTHFSVGIVATCPQSGGRGVARAMLEEVLAVAEEAGCPVRLVSSLMNLDSFSLYTRLGFVPGMAFQDLQFPAGVLPPGEWTELPSGGRAELRVAGPADVEELTRFERELTGLDRETDFRYFLRNADRGWHTLILRDGSGAISGCLASVHRDGIRMVGPGLAADVRSAMALIAAQLHYHAPGNPVFLVPARESALVAALYRAGARNVELHTAQVWGAAREPAGIVMPTFLPESG